MAQNRNNNDSLSRSHSTWSNTKLTSLCIITIILFTLCWLILGCKALILVVLSETIYYIILGAVATLTVLCLIGFNKFKR